jgi:hypothetical protein
VTDDAGIVTKISPRSVADTVTRFTGILGATYYSPDELAARYQLGPDLAGNLAAINPITDALIAP